eukprot:gene6721-4816_t
MHTSLLVVRGVRRSALMIVFPLRVDLGLHHSVVAGSIVSVEKRNVRLSHVWIFFVFCLSFLSFFAFRFSHLLFSFWSHSENTGGVLVLLWYKAFARFFVLNFYFSVFLFLNSIIFVHMKRRAQLGFHAQCLLHNHTNTVPDNVKKYLNVEVVGKEIQGAKTMTEDLHNVFRSSKIAIPFAGGKNERKENEDTTVFVLDFTGTIQPQPYAEVLRQKGTENVHRFCADAIPKNPKILEAVRTAAEKATELKAPYQEAAASKFTDIYANERLQKAFGNWMAKEMKEKSKNPVVKEVEGALLWDMCASLGIKTVFFSDVKPFFETAGRKASDNQAKKSCIVLYSSAPVSAQETFVSNAQDGDLSPYITEYLDTNYIGSKLLARSYTKMRVHLTQKLGPNIKIVFITGNSSEASAAESSGDVDCTILCLRPCNEWMTIDTFVAVNLPHIVSLSQIVQPELPVDFGSLAAEAIRSSSIFFIIIYLFFNYLFFGLAGIEVDLVLSAAEPHGRRSYRIPHLQVNSSIYRNRRFCASLLLVFFPPSTYLEKALRKLDNIYSYIYLVGGQRMFYCHYHYHNHLLSSLNVGGAPPLKTERHRTHSLVISKIMSDGFTSLSRFLARRYRNGNGNSDERVKYLYIFTLFARDTLVVLVMEEISCKEGYVGPRVRCEDQNSRILTMRTFSAKFHFRLYKKRRTFLHGADTQTDNARKSLEEREVVFVFLRSHFYCQWDVLSAFGCNCLEENLEAAPSTAPRRRNPPRHALPRGPDGAPTPPSSAVLSESNFLKRRFEYIEPQSISALRDYKSSSQDCSLLSNYVMKYYWEAVVEIIPKSIAPNLITLTGFLVGMAGPLTALYFHLSDAETTPSWVWALSAISLFGYQTCDAVDGKQARRTKCSSPLGEFLDHGLDAMITQFVMLNMVLACNAAPWGGCLILFQSSISLFLCIWEQFSTGVFFLGYLSGPTEGIILTCIEYLITFFCGIEVWDSTPLGTYNVPIPSCVLDSLLRTFAIEDSGAGNGFVRVGSMRSIFIIGITVSWIFTVLGNFINVIKLAHNKRRAAFLALPMVVPAFVHLHLYARFPSVHDAFYPWFELSFGTLVAICCAKMCVSRLTRTLYNPFHVYYFSFVLFHLTLLVLHTLYSTYAESLALGFLMICLTLLGVFCYAHFMFSVTYQVKNYFDIPSGALEIEMKKKIRSFLYSSALETLQIFFVLFYSSTFRAGQFFPSICSQAGCPYLIHLKAF